MMERRQEFSRLRYYTQISFLSEILRSYENAVNHYCTLLNLDSKLWKYCMLRASFHQRILAKAKFGKFYATWIHSLLWEMPLCAPHPTLPNDPSIFVHLQKSLLACVVLSLLRVYRTAIWVTNSNMVYKLWQENDFASNTWVWAPASKHPKRYILKYILNLVPRILYFVSCELWVVRCNERFIYIFKESSSKGIQGKHTNKEVMQNRRGIHAKAFC